MIFLSVIIPAYNEEKRIKETLLQVSDYLAVQDYEYEIMVVNDGSTDATASLVQELCLDHVSLIDFGENHGKGWAVRQGLLRAVGQYRLFADADNSTPIEELAKLLPFVKEGYDVVIASRSIEGANIGNHQPLHRKILGNAYRVLAGVIAGLGDIKDTQCGFKLLSEDAARRVLPQCRINGWSFDVEVLAVAKKLGYKIKEVPVSWADNPHTKVRFLGMVAMAFDLVKIRWNLITGKYET